VFDRVLGERPNQKAKLRDDVHVTAAELLDVRIPGAAITERGLRGNVSVGLAYLSSWLAGNGAAAISNLMEDAATAEISRSQLWQWRVHASLLDDGRPMSDELYQGVRDEELSRLRESAPDTPWADAAALLDELVLSDEFTEFLTKRAYSRLG
jgi:malate synthase